MGLARCGYGAVLLVLAILVGRTQAVRAQPAAFINQEPEIKASYLYNFARYVEWPAAAGANGFDIGVVGENGVIEQLRTLAKTKKVNNRPINVRQFKTEKEFQSCHILFVSAGQDPKLVTALLKKAGETATLIVGEDENFALKHGHIGFYIEKNSVKFEINPGSAKQATLKISAKLLTLGKIVGK